MLLRCAVFIGLSVALAAQGPPETRRGNYRETLHGIEIIDPYRWLEEQDSPETRKWIDAQNEYSRSLLLPQPFREPIARRFKQLLQGLRYSAPIIRKGVYYFEKKDPGDELWSTYRRRGFSGIDELLIDPHKLSQDNRTSAAMIGVSDDGRILAWFLRRGGEDEAEIRFLDLSTNKELEVRIPRHLNRGFELKRDGSGAFYTVQDRESGPRVQYIDLRSGTVSDVAGGKYTTNTFVRPMLAGKDRYLVLQVQEGWARSELMLKPLDSAEPPVALTPGIDAHFVVSLADDDHVIVQTTWKAPNRRIMLVDLREPSVGNWKEIVPEADDVIQGCSVVGGKLFVRYLHDVVTRIRSFSLDGKALGDVALPGTGSGNLWGSYDEPEGVMTYTSFNAPPRTFVYDSRSGRTKLFARAESPIDTGSFEVRQVWFNSKDGTRVPMFLTHKKGLKPDGKLPVLLYGYGGFNVSLTPSFNPYAALWMEQGGVFAVANIRGGGEFGERWHQDGMLAKKQNVFDDFIAAAEWLIANRYTNPKRLAIMGGSNGGLLVGAALTQRPDLFRAVLCQYPDLDMLGTYRFKNFNKPALLEYGDASKPDEFQFLYAYSPYQKVKEGTRYPAVLLTTGDADTRVPPLQARKMTARLQHATASGNPVLLLYDTLSGHAGGRPQSRIVEDSSLELAFLFWQLDMEWTEPPAARQPRKSR